MCELTRFDDCDVRDVRDVRDIELLIDGLKFDATKLRKKEKNTGDE